MDMSTVDPIAHDHLSASSTKALPKKLIRAALTVSYGQSITYRMALARTGANHGRKHGDRGRLVVLLLLADGSSASDANMPSVEPEEVPLILSVIGASLCAEGAHEDPGAYAK